MEGLRQRRKDTSIVTAVTKSLDTIKDFDLYPKLKDDHKKSEKTTTGAIGAGGPSPQQPRGCGPAAPAVHPRRRRRAHSVHTIDVRVLCGPRPQ